MVLSYIYINLWYTNELHYYVVYQIAQTSTLFFAILGVLWAFLKRLPSFKSFL